MMKSQCCLCSKQRNCHKLLSKCKHDSACYDCLRFHYIKRPRDASFYPLRCFHPDCHRQVCHTHIEKLCQSDTELQKYHYLAHLARVNGAKFGKEWRGLLGALKALESELCQCPKCGFVITKDGGCDHITCICGEIFDWNKTCISIERLLIGNYAKNLIEEDLAAFRSHSKREKGPTGSLHYGDGFNDGDGDEAEESISELNLEVSNKSSIGLKKSKVAMRVPEYHQISEYLQTIATFKESTLPTSASVAKSTTSIAMAIDKDEEGFEFVDWKSNSRLASDSCSISSNHTTWEELSVVSDVESFDSLLQLSYLDTVRSDSKTWRRAAFKPTPKLCPILEEPSNFVQQSNVGEEGEDSEVFDCSFVHDGMKCTRGGKVKFFYNHEPKRRNPRWERNIRKRERKHNRRNRPKQSKVHRYELSSALKALR